MKKLLWMMALMVAMLVLPLGVRAADDLVFNCTSTDSDGMKTCKVSYNITGDGIDEAEITVEEEGGADIQEITAASDDGWEINGTPSESSGKWTVSMTNIDKQSGERAFINIKYKVSGQDDCGIKVTLLGSTKTETEKETTPEKKTPSGKCVYDKEAQKYYINGEEVTQEEYKNACPPTGPSLPYIALATIALIAVGAYVATLNKTKIFKI